MSFPARYGARCAADCIEDFIYPGDLIEYVEGQIVHEGCTPAVVVDRAPRPVCPDCFTEITPAGTCGC